ncbi:MAG: hypothetical protein HND48_23880 [Chloroflexi bacterium]|nr:hypothetical protein [Chloroflexota bacterium]
MIRLTVDSAADGRISEREAPVSEITRVGVLAHPLRPQTFPVAEQIAESLRTRDIGAAVFTEWHDAEVAAVTDMFDLVIAIGGDGAMLRAARVCAPFDVPVLGINMGQPAFDRGARA